MDTVRIKSSHPPSQGDFVVIDARTYDPAKHELHGDAVAPRRLSPRTASPFLTPATIPADWSELSWKEKRALAGALSDKPVINEQEANVVITAAVGDQNANAIPDDWEKLPWFSLRKQVEQKTGTRPKTKTDAIRLMKAHSAETGS